MSECKRYTILTQIARNSQYSMNKALNFLNCKKLTNSFRHFLEINTNNFFLFLQRIGSGTYGDVYKARRILPNNGKSMFTQLLFTFLLWHSVSCLFTDNKYFSSVKIWKNLSLLTLITLKKVAIQGGASKLDPTRILAILQRRNLKFS